MHTDIIISGFGGQGVLFAGQLLAYAGMDEKMEVTWFPSYGPEMRGGTANCTVILSNEEIGSPMVRSPMVVIAMNLPSLVKYENQIKPGGLLIINSSIIDEGVKRKDIRVVRLPGNEIAEKIGDKRMTNMVMLGALIANQPVLPLEALEKALKEHLPARHHRLLPFNYQALREGANFLADPVRV
jgi:2-oxoglutarate ferredoxin oxidoreductase subunit gamma